MYLIDGSNSDAGQTVDGPQGTPTADAPAPRKPKKERKVAKKAKAKKVAKKATKVAKKANGMRAMTGEGLAGQMRLNEGPRAEMAKHLERNKGKFVTLATLAKPFGKNGDVLARQAVIRFRGKIAKYKLPFEIRTDEETAGRYGLFAKR